MYGGKVKKRTKKSMQNRSPSWRAKIRVFTHITYINTWDSGN